MTRHGCGFPNDDVAGLESPSAVPPVKDRYGAARSVSSSSRFMNLFASGSDHVERHGRERQTGSLP